MLLQDTTADAPSFWTSLINHPLFEEIIGIALLVLVAWLVDWLVKRILVRLVSRLVERSSATWDDAFLKHNVFGRLAHLAPGVVVYYGINLIPGLNDNVILAIQRAVGAVLIVLAAVTIGAAVTAVGDIALTSKLARGRPIRAYFQVVNLMVYIVTGVLVLAALLGAAQASEPASAVRLQPVDPVDVLAGTVTLRGNTGAGRMNPFPIRLDKSGIRESGAKSTRSTLAWAIRLRPLAAMTS